MLRRFAAIAFLAAFLARPAGSDESPAAYAPDRLVDVLRLSLDLTIDFPHHAIDGSATLRLTPIREGEAELSLDAVDLEIHHVFVNGRPAEFRATGEKLVVRYPQVPRPGDEVEVVVRYGASPEEGGLYWSDPEPGADWYQVWSQGESVDSRLWFPCVDTPEERQSVELTVTVPEGYEAVSNGPAADAHEIRGATTYRFRLEQEIPAYLVTLVVGRFDVWEDYLSAPVVRAFVPEGHGDECVAFQDTRYMIEFYESRIGVDFPFPKYDQVVVREFTFGGMENAGATTLHERALENERSHIDRPAEGLIAHELAHQWWGDLVTCRSWEHIWLNEGFATYFEALWTEAVHGEAAFAREMLDSAGAALHAGAERPVVDRHYGDADDIFTGRVYQKGAWILHMLRGMLGDDLFFQGLHRYATDHAFGPVETDDLRRAFEAVSGRSLGRFFDQWCGRPGAPVIEVAYRYDANEGLAIIDCRQTQEGEPFTFPLEVEVDWHGGRETQAVEMAGREASFTVPVGGAPIAIRVDPREVVLKDLRFPQGLDLLEGALLRMNDPAGRIRACRALGEQRLDGAVRVLVQALTIDPAPEIRAEAASALARTAPAAAREALVRALADPDPDVRAAAAEALGCYRGDVVAADALTRLIQEGDGSYDVEEAATRALARTATIDAADALMARLDPRFRSPMETLRQTAVWGFAELANPDYIDPIIPLTRRGNYWQLREAAIGAVGRLGALRRTGEERREGFALALQPLLDDPSRNVREAAIGALRDLGAEGTLPALEAVVRRDPNDGIRDAAREAMEAIRSGAAHPDAELDRLRAEIDELRHGQEDLRRLVEPHGAPDGGAAGPRPF